MMTTATMEKASTIQQGKPALITQDYNQKAAYDSFRAQGFAKGKDINVLVQDGKLTYAVRGDEFVIMSAPGKKLGAKVECDGQTYFVKDPELQKRTNVAIVLSFSQLSMRDGVIEGNIVKVLDVPEKDGWYNVDDDTAIPQAGRGSRSSDSTARYWYRREGEQYIGAVVRGYICFDGSGWRYVCAHFRPGGGFGVALASPAQAKAELKPELLAKQLTEQAQAQLALLLRQAEGVEQAVEALRGTTRPEFLEPMDAMLSTVRQLRIKE